MKLLYSQEAREQLKNIKEYISKDNKDVAVQHLLKIKLKLEILEDYPYIGKVNSTFNIENIREFVVFGYKIIYKINIRIFANNKYRIYVKERINSRSGTISPFC